MKTKGRTIGPKGEQWEREFKGRSQRNRGGHRARKGAPWHDGPIVECEDIECIRALAEGRADASLSGARKPHQNN